MPLGPLAHPESTRLRLQPAAVAVALATLAALPLPAQALGADAWNTGFIIDFNEKWLREDALNRALSQARKDMNGSSRTRREFDPRFETDVLYTGSQSMEKGEFLLDGAVRKLAGMYPPAQRKQSEALFTQIISSFNDNVERLYKVSPQNLATGVGVLLAGGWSAYHNKPFPDQWVRPLVTQVDDVLRKQPELFKDKSTYVRESYQMGVGIGMLLLTAQAELAKGRAPAGVDAAGLKAVGGQVLQALLGAPPDRIEFSSSGFRVR